MQHRTNNGVAAWSGGGLQLILSLATCEMFWAISATSGDINVCRGPNNDNVAHETQQQRRRKRRQLVMGR